MITGPEGRQTHTLLDLKKQQWAKEREEIARMDELFSSSHQSSTSHHKIERTSIRTFYSNLDLSQDSSLRNRTNRQQQFQSQPPVINQMNAVVPLKPQQLQRGSSYDYHNTNTNRNHDLEHYVDNQQLADDDDDADFEDNDDNSSYRRLSRGGYAMRDGQPRNNTTSRMAYMPGNRKCSYGAEVGPILQTAKARIQNAQQRLRSPSLPVIKQRDYFVRHNHSNNNNSNNQNGNQQQQQHIVSSVLVVEPGNTQQHRFNNPTAIAVIPGCQEEDTSGYLSDSPKNTHTPDIWYNDGVSQNESNRGVGTGETRRTDTGIATGGVGGSGGGEGCVVNEVDAIATKNKRSMRLLKKQQSNRENYARQQQQQHAQYHKEQEILNSTYTIEGRPPPQQEKLLGYGVSSMDAGLTANNDGYQGSYYVPIPSPSILSRDVSTSNTYAVHPADQLDFYNSNKIRGARERAKWMQQQSLNYQQGMPNVGGPTWLSRGHHDQKDSEDDTQSMHSSYLRGQNAPLDPITLAERIDKRRKAAEYHNAIKQQLQEREMIRKWEIERHLQEERIEEERIMRQKQVEKERLEYERRQQLEREELQRKKQQAMLDAITQAEVAAKFERDKKRKGRVPPLARENSKDALEENAKEKNAQVVSIKESPKTKEKRREKRETATEISTKEIETALTEEHNVEGLEENLINEDNIIEEAQSEETVEQPIEEEKVLIGTPINLRRATKKPAYPAKSKPKVVEYRDAVKDEKENVAVIMQPATLIPLPVTTDIFGLQNAIGNLQIATFLMQQQLKPPATATSTKTSGDGTTQRTDDTFTTEDLDHLNLASAERCGALRPLCNRCGKCHFHEKQSTHMCGVSSTGDTVEELNTKNSNERDKLALIPVQPTTQRAESPCISNEQHSEHLHDVETQTELPLNCDLCLFHDNFYKVLLKREVSTTTTTQTSKTSKAKPVPTPATSSPDKDHDEMTTTTTTTTTTTFKAKAKQDKEKEKEKEKEKRRNKDGKKDDRPKWGVNRPVVQYVKASDRDPFCLRYKKKGGNTKPSRSQSVDSRLDNTAGMQPNGDDAGTEEEDAQEGFLLKARNVCTEILPIKTDEKGRIFLNFREASAIMNEDEIKDKLRQKYFNIGRILPRRSWASATQHGMSYSVVGGISDD